MRFDLNYYWRLIATGFCYTCFGLFGLLLSVVVFPAVKMLSIQNKRAKRNIQKIISLSFRLFLWEMEYLGVMRPRQTIRKASDAEGPFLIIASHPTLIDVIYVLSEYPFTDCVVKLSLWKNFFLSGVVKSANYIPNEDPLQLIEECTSRLQTGQNVLIFPEGTRSTRKTQKNFKKGAAIIALRSQCKILPLDIQCSPSTLSKNEKWYHIPAEKFQISMFVGIPVTCTEISPLTPSLQQNAQLVTDFFQNYFYNKESK